MQTISDEELVTRCRVELPGNTRSYELLVQRYMNQVYTLIYRMIGSREESEDLTQEVFVKVYNNLKKFEQQSAFSSWLYRIATNTALDALDKMKHHPKVAEPVAAARENSEETDLLNLQPSSLAGPEDSAIQNELRDCIRNVLKKLERDQARMLVMRDFNDQTYDEIATLLGLGLSAVKMRIHRSRLAFQEIYTQICTRAGQTLSKFGSSARPLTRNPDPIVPELSKRN